MFLITNPEGRVLAPLAPAVHVSGTNGVEVTLLGVVFTIPAAGVFLFSLTVSAPTRSDLKKGKSGPCQMGLV